MLTLAASFANALSRKMTVVSPSGLRSECQAAMPSAIVEMSARGIEVARQQKRTPSSTHQTVAPAMMRVAIGAQRSRPSLRINSYSTSPSVRPAVTCSTDSRSAWPIFGGDGSHVRTFVESSLKAQKPTSSDEFRVGVPDLSRGATHAFFRQFPATLRGRLGSSQYDAATRCAGSAGSSTSGS